MGRFELRTHRGYILLEVASAMQKAIRRADVKLACYWSVELSESGYQAYAWRRLLIISAEDVYGPITSEIEALRKVSDDIEKKRKGETRLFIAKATILLCMAEKCRDADHAICFVYDHKSGLTDAQILADLDEARKNIEPIPEYAFDVHTAKGRKAGKTAEDFFREEFEALKPRVAGLFDSEVPV